MFCLNLWRMFVSLWWILASLFIFKQTLVMSIWRVVFGIFQSKFHFVFVSFSVSFLWPLNISKSFHVNFHCRIDMVEVLCNIVKNLSPYSGSVLAMSMNVNILAKMMKWYFSRLFFWKHTFISLSKKIGLYMTEVFKFVWFFSRL